MKKLNRKNLGVINFDDWKALRIKSAPTPDICECCDGSGEVDLYDSCGNEYEAECKECDGCGEEKPVEYTRKDYLRELRGVVRRYIKFTGVMPKLYYISDRKVSP